MPNWKRVIVSGSSAHLNHVTASGNISGSSISTGSFGHLMQDGKDLPPFHTTGSSMYIGKNAGASDDGSDNNNIGIGENVLDGVTTGQRNIAIGFDSMTDNVTGNYNVAVGWETLKDASGGQNVAIGYSAMEFASTGQNNVGIGFTALSGVVTGDYNVAIGYTALTANTSGANNIAIGYSAMAKTTTTGDNIGIGDFSLYEMITAAGNGRSVAIGSEALRHVKDVGGVSGFNNTAVGWNAGKSYTGGNLVSASYGVFLGHTTKASANNSINEIVIGSQAIGKGSNTATIGDDNITDIYMSEDVGATVHTGNVSGSSTSILTMSEISSSGDIVAEGDVVAYNSSDVRLKDNIEVIKGSLDKIGEIRGVEFDWNDKSPGWAQERGHDIGVIAQEVQKVVPEIVVERKNGYLGVDYKRLVPLLIESVKELRQEVNDLKKKVS